MNEHETAELWDRVVVDVMLREAYQEAVALSGDPETARKYWWYKVTDRTLSFGVDADEIQDVADEILPIVAAKFEQYGVEPQLTIHEDGSVKFATIEV